MEKRGRPPLDPRVKEIIFDKAIRNRTTPRKVLAPAISQTLRDKKLPVPRPSTLMREISEARGLRETELDTPWSLGSIIKHPIPPETLSVVMGIHKKRLMEREGDPDQVCVVLDNDLTIREALWVSRLCVLIPDPEQVEGYATWYAIRERAYEAHSQPPDTSDLDESIMGLPIRTKGKTTITTTVNDRQIDLTPFKHKKEESEEGKS